MAITELHHDAGASTVEYYRLRSNPRRRATIEVLAETERLSTDELAERVSERLPAERTEDTTKLRLHHADLPLFAEAGLVDFDPAAGTVTVIEPVSGLLV